MRDVGLCRVAHLHCGPQGTPACAHIKPLAGVSSFILHLCSWSLAVTQEQRVTQCIRALPGSQAAMRTTMPNSTATELQCT